MTSSGFVPLNFKIKISCCPKARQNGLVMALEMLGSYVVVHDDEETELTGLFSSVQEEEIESFTTLFTVPALKSIVWQHSSCLANSFSGYVAIKLLSSVLRLVQSQNKISFFPTHRQTRLSKLLFQLNYCH